MWVDGWGDLPGQLFVVSGPSGCGKSSVIRAALESGRLNAGLSVSATTRARRPGETEGVDYHFLTIGEFDRLRADNGFLESAEYNLNRYGTPATPVYEALKEGRSLILEIEVVGALQVRSRAPAAFFLFIKTPSFRTLEARLRARGTETDEAILRRLRKGREELAEAHWYDHVLINDSFDTCVDEFIGVLRSNGCGG
jgi:guanylate kinase